MCIRTIRTIKADVESFSFQVEKVLVGIVHAATTGAVVVEFLAADLQWFWWRLDTGRGSFDEAVKVEEAEGLYRCATVELLV